ncbi:hypothetical protein EKG36_19305 [Halomonas nitroreducens]|uniref:Uncharacterized protein n=1 Tax=Halomonas nitroreducens TaxID=447425 RepID=A0A3S0KN13_9GAMM|nr:hypothetical protein EKG36_19305 [Halomonas nitroreducens]
MVKRRGLQGVNEHFKPIVNAVLPSADTCRTLPRLPRAPAARQPAGRSSAPGRGSRTARSGR